MAHRLGSGGFGIVWLCYDNVHKKWIAVKIMTANASEERREEKIYDHLRRRASPKELAESHLVVPLEEFWIEGPNGRHLCLVLPVLGGSVKQWRGGLEPRDEMMSRDLKKFCFQVTEAVRFLHRCGICHGDLKPANILLTVHGIEDMGKEELEELLGEPEAWEVETRSGDPPAPRGPEYIVCPPQEQWWKNTLTALSL